MARPAKLAIHPLTPDRWDDLAKLFGPRGACAGCWCMYPRNTRSEGATSGDPNRRAFQKLVRSGPPPGLLAYDGGEPQWKPIDGTPLKAMPISSRSVSS